MGRRGGIPLNGSVQVEQVCPVPKSILRRVWDMKPFWFTSLTKTYSYSCPRFHCWFVFGLFKGLTPDRFVPTPAPVGVDTMGDSSSGRPITVRCGKNLFDVV